MSRIVQLTLAVGRPGTLVAPAEAVRIAGAAGVTALRLVDSAAAGRALDPTVLVSYLAGLHGDLHYIAEVPTTGNAPYNTARRVLSLDRATGGRVGVALRAGHGDEVSEASAPDPGATGSARRWTEYARVLTRLWESFPRDALIGDQVAGIVVDDTLIRPIGHEGEFYRVYGPLDGPSSVQGRLVIVADLGVLDVTAVAPSADVVVVGREHAAGVDAALTAALEQVGRSRREVALLGRATMPWEPGELIAWADEHGLDGFEVSPQAGVEALRALDPAPPGPTLRAALGLQAVAS